MNTSSVFTLPAPGHVTACEQKGQLENVPALEEKIILASMGLELPEVEITDDTFKHSISKETARSAFIEHNQTLTKRLIHAWYEHGVDGVFEELAQQRQAPFVAKSASLILSVVRWINTLHGSLLPHHSMTRDEMLQEFSACREWDSSPIRAIAWHEQTEKLAVCLLDDSIRIYRSDKHHIIPTLKHKQQKMVAKLAWRPYSASQLAVACGSCVLVWTVDPMSISTRPSSSLAEVLSSAGHCPVVDVAWCPHSAMLVSASPSDTAIMSWDLSNGQCTPLRRLGGGGVTSLAWAPDGSKLFSATPALMFRVWDCSSWTCERWTKLQGPCLSACWSPCASVLLFATKEDHMVYSVEFPQAGDYESGFAGSTVARACLSVEPRDVSRGLARDSPRGVARDAPRDDADHVENVVKVGGYVHTMIWDPTGQRLAIMFKNSEDCVNECVALYRTRIKPMLEIMPIGLISGRAGERPCLISFLPNFTRGALLTVVWSSGRVGYVPLWFLSASEVHQRLEDHHSHRPLPSGGASTLYSVQH